ncbi:hypothetical protein E2C01_049204 [Portunus trituberculatus]|uniref:Uncharacterized protein n=1 Tax=Portunus trituberculatus TaxID=210409 RepID=A0A5B7G8L3_PORTR|nr:hypothetical protein [Portunus trituberculatus]
MHDLRCAGNKAQNTVGALSVQTCGCSQQLPNGVGGLLIIILLGNTPVGPSALFHPAGRRRVREREKEKEDGRETRDAIPPSRDATGHATSPRPKAESPEVPPWFFL